MSDAKTYPGSCFCGTVQFTVTGDPVAMGYCHCDSCRNWSAGPINAFSLWKPESLAITKGADKLGSYSKNPQTHRKWCTSCGGAVYGDHPTFGLVDVFAAKIPTFPFEPAMHIFYAEKTMSVRDGLPKMKDMPKEMGGSGETLPE
jgi:hypothetical protein